MAAAVKAAFTVAEEKALGNVIYNGYIDIVPNTINKKAWQYKETNTPPVDLPSLSVWHPALKGWTTNYMEYFTQLVPVPSYGTTSGDPTNFAFVVHSYTAANEPQWAQAPRRFYQDQVAPTVPPSVNQQAIPYTFMYPVADNPVPPPVDVL